MFRLPKYLVCYQKTCDNVIQFVPLVVDTYTKIWCCKYML